MMEQTIYTVNVRFMDKTRTTHEKAFPFNSREAASEFSINVESVLKRMKRVKAIREYKVDTIVTFPPSPAT